MQRKKWNNGVLEGSQKLGYVKEISNIQQGKKAVYSYVPKQIKDYVNVYPERFINMSLRDAAILTKFNS